MRKLRSVQRDMEGERDRLLSRIQALEAQVLCYAAETKNENSVCMAWDMQLAGNAPLPQQCLQCCIVCRTCAQLAIKTRMVLEHGLSPRCS